MACEILDGVFSAARRHAVVACTQYYQAAQQYLTLGPLVQGMAAYLNDWCHSFSPKVCWGFFVCLFFSSDTDDHCLYIFNVVRMTALYVF